MVVWVGGFIWRAHAIRMTHYLFLVTLFLYHCGYTLGTAVGSSIATLTHRVTVWKREGGGGSGERRGRDGGRGEEGVGKGGREEEEAG